MKTTMLIALFALVGTSTLAQNSILGTWKPVGQHGIFKIFEYEGKYYGKLIGSTKAKEDEKIKANDAPVLLRELQKKSDTEYCCGTFIVPKKETETAASIKVQDENTLVMTVSKYSFTKDITWERIDLADYQ